MTISFSGLASGIDTSSWIEALTSIKQVGVTSLQSKQNSINAEKAAVNKIQSLFSDVQTALDAITDSKFGNSADLFNRKGVNYEDAQNFTASITSEAAEGTYNIFVKQLATATVAKSSDGVSKRISESTSLSDLGVTSGSLTLWTGSEKYDIQIDKNDTIAEFNEKLANEGISAALSVNEDGSLTFAGTDDNSVALNSATDTSNFLTKLGLTRKQDTVSGPYYYETDKKFYAMGLNTKLVQTDESNVYANSGSLNAGTLTINRTGFEITENTTLGDLINAINASETAKVKASWDDAEGKLILTSTEVGGKYIDVKEGTTNFSSLFNIGAPDTQTLGQNALINIGGRATEEGIVGGTNIVSYSNTVTSDVSGISGLTINLLKESETVNGKLVAEKLSVETDTADLEYAIADFVDKYNTLISEANSYTSASGALHTDSTLKSLISKVKSTLNSQINNEGTYKLLSQIGISTAGAGASLTANTELLSLDARKLHEAVSNNSDDVKKLLLGNNSEYTNGVFTRLNNLMFDSMSSKGFFATRNDLYSKQVSRYDNLISTAKTRVSNYKSSLENKFASMEKLIATMQSSYTKMYSMLGMGTSSSLYY
ncbi:flagellar filament capping protein FliD [bacterium]|nr:flagellar filament capping protein FliD [bacterium]